MTETNAQNPVTQADGGKTTADVKPPETKTADDKGGDDVEALKRHNQKLLTELTNKKGELNEFKGKYETLQSEKDAREAEELKAQGKYKEALEKEVAKNQGFQKQVLKAQLQTFAFKEGILDDDLIDMIPTDKIKVTTVNDSIQISGAEEAVKAYKAAKPHLFKAADAGTTTTTTTGSATGAAVTDPRSASGTNAVANGVKPGSKEANELEKAYLAKWSR